MFYNDLTKLSTQDLENGYFFSKEKGAFFCLLCGKKFENGIIYSFDDLLADSQKAIKIHISREHEGVLDFLLDLDKKNSGLTDQQKEIIRLTGKGQSNREISAALAISESTVRNHKFRLKEKGKQAKIFLALMNLSKSNEIPEEILIDFPESVDQFDERFAVTLKEENEILEKYFKDNFSELKRPPKKEKEFVVILKKITEISFEKEKHYSEKEINLILERFTPDYALVRRYLIDYGFLLRTANGKEYWLNC